MRLWLPLELGKYPLGSKQFIQLEIEAGRNTSRLNL